MLIGSNFSSDWGHFGKMISFHVYVFLLSYLPFSCGTQCKDLDSGENLVILAIVASWAMDTDYCMDLEILEP